MAVQIENLNVPLPDGFAAIDFMDGHSFTPNRSAIMQLLDGNLNLSQIAEYGNISVSQTQILIGRSWPHSKRLLDRLASKNIIDQHKKNPDYKRDRRHDIS